MGKGQKKTGKGRLDKYYKLAKEQGYRARSAFKLIQLNKKYAFLEGARCCIDLCAAPGGWLQVASKYMPPNSLIVGVDLVPIRPIPRVATFAADITTTNCRNLLRGELKDWKADIVLHDGAPNVGTAWVQDAYSQSELVLMSLKLAVDFLMKGGTFVTKIFRSQDYNNLLWVFSQLFGKVEATKPPSSRNVSAEIFVVCRDFLAPKFIDPKFLDPQHVFKDLAPSTAPIDPAALEKGSSAANAQANVFAPEKKRRHRDGYADDDYTLHRKTGVADFIKGADPISVLGSVNQLTFTSEEEKGWLELAVTSPDVKANCDDLKVLGKGDFKSLLKWRTTLREEIGLQSKTKETEELTEAVEVTEELDEEEQIQNELERLNAEASSRTKRARRKANEHKQRTVQRMQLRMVAPLDIGLEQTDAQLGMGQDDVFDLDNVEQDLGRGKDVTRLAEGEMADDGESDDGAQPAAEDEEDTAVDSDEERERKVKGLEDELDGLYDAYRTQMAERDAKFRVKESRKKNALRNEEWGGVKEPGSDDEGSNDESEGEGGWHTIQKHKAAGDVDDDSSGDDEDEDVAKVPTKRRKLVDGKAGLITKLNDKPKLESSKAAQVWFSQDLFAGVPDVDEIEQEEEPEESSEESAEEAEDVEDVAEDDASSDGNDFEVVPQEPDHDFDMWDVDGEDEDAEKQRKILNSGLLTAEAVTLAQQLVNRQTTRTHLINEGFNRYSLNSADDLPTWFLDDESQHYRPNIPITKEAVAALRAKQRALDARPIKKIAEAKARKKFKAAQRLDKALKKAEGLTESSDMTEREKAQQIDKVMRKGASSGQKRKEMKVVVARGVNKGVKGRPKGVKGRYQMVDARMRKELRAKKRVEKANKKRKRT